MTDFATHPTRKDRLFFAVILAVIGVVLGYFVATRAFMLLVGATIAAVLVGLAWLTGHTKSVRSLLVPLLLIALRQLSVSATSPATAGVAVAAAFLLLAGLSLRADFGNWFYVQWMRAVEPLGWAFSCVLFSGVYFLLLTPIGLLMRAIRYDPLQRKLDREAKSYWIARDQNASHLDYFRQF